MKFHSAVKKDLKLLKIKNAATMISVDSTIKKMVGLCIAY